jgi:hypothetical protein
MKHRWKRKLQKHYSVGEEQRVIGTLSQSDAANTTPISLHSLPANLWLQTGKETEMNAAEEIVKESLFCLPSPYP